MIIHVIPCSHSVDERHHHNRDPRREPKMRTIESSTFPVQPDVPATTTSIPSFNKPVLEIMREDGAGTPHRVVSVQRLFSRLHGRALCSGIDWEIGGAAFCVSTPPVRNQKAEIIGAALIEYQRLSLSQYFPRCSVREIRQSVFKASPRASS